MKTRKMTAFLLAAAMVASMTGCSMLGGGKAKEEVLAAADSFASNVCSMKANKIISATADAEDMSDALSMAFAIINDDAILSQIASTLAYEIDEESVEADTKKGEASVDVVFTYVDADSVYADVIEDGGDEEAFIAALGDSDDVVEVELTLEFTLEDDEWLVDDSELECLEDIFDFADNEYEFAAPFMDAYEGHSWWMADDENNYSDAYYIDFWGTYDWSMLNEDPELYFTVEHDGTLVYTSETSSSADCYFYAEDYGYDVLPEGSYTITLYLADGTLVDSDSCYVYVSDESAITEDDFYYGTDCFWYEYSSDGSSQPLYDNSGNLASDPAPYTTNDFIMERTIHVMEGYEDVFTSSPLYYEVYFSADGDMDSAELIYSDTISAILYPAGYYFECQYTTDMAGSDFEVGSYYFVVCSAQNTNLIFDIGTAEVS